VALSPVATIECPYHAISSAENQQSNRGPSGDCLCIGIDVGHSFCRLDLDAGVLRLLAQRFAHPRPVELGSMPGKRHTYRVVAGGTSRKYGTAGTRWTTWPTRTNRGAWNQWRRWFTWRNGPHGTHWAAWRNGTARSQRCRRTERCCWTAWPHGTHGTDWSTGRHRSARRGRSAWCHRT